MLAPYGFRKANLPKAIGGEFGFDCFVQWQDLRTRYEWYLPAIVTNTNNVANDAFDFSSATPLSQLTVTERTERKRRLNVVHSRRKRERERIEILNEQCDEHRERKKVLEEENAKLFNLLAQAMSFVPSGSGDTMRPREVASSTFHSSAQV